MISVIIPTYNNAEFLKRSIGSLPSSPSVQIIVVDDGSTDNTQAVLACIKDSYPGMVVIHKERGGVSSARNLGLKLASGDYIVFLDADDAISPGAFEIVLGTDKWPEADIVIMRSFAETERYPWKGLFSEDSLYRAPRLIKAGYIRGSVCGCLFRRSFIEKAGATFCEELTNGEDTVFFATLLSNGARLVFSDTRLYEVTQREKSASRRYDKGFVTRLGKTMNAVRSTVQDKAVADNTILAILFGIVHIAVKSGYSADDVRGLVDLGAVLPLSPAVFGRNKFVVRILNKNFNAFYTIKKLKDRLSGK